MPRRALLQFCLLALLAVIFTGCASDETENRSARPWNTPKMWEHGVPASIMEGR